MKLPLRLSIGVTMLVATAGMTVADPDPPPIYLTCDPDTGDCWIQEDVGPDLDPGLRSEDPQTNYDSLDGIDDDGDGANFAGPYSPVTSLVDDYQMWSGVSTMQTLVTHSFRAGFGGSGNADGRLSVTFYDLNMEEVSSYLVNLTGNEGFNTFVVSFTRDLPIAPQGHVEFRWLANDPPNTSFGLMEDEPQLGFNTAFLRDGVNDINPPGAAFPGISQAMVTTDIPAPGSLAPIALAGFGCVRRRRKR